MQMPGPRTRTSGVSVLGVTLRTLRNINDLRATKTEHYKKYGTLFVFKDLALVTLVTLHHLTEQCLCINTRVLRRPKNLTKGVKSEGFLDLVFSTLKINI